MSALETYYSSVLGILEEVFEREREAMEQAARALAAANREKRSVFAFGCNHAGLLALELFYRTGGMVTVNPVRAPGMMLEVSPITMSSELERIPGYGRVIFESLQTKEGDVILIHSVSGRNAVTVDMAKAAKEKGLMVIVLTNLRMAEAVLSRHPSGKKLHDFADILIDNHGDYGDAAVRLEGFSQKVAPTSTVAGAAILNAVIARACELLLQEGVMPPVFMSGNLEGGDEHNRSVIGEHRGNIYYM